MLILSGSSHPKFAAALAKELKAPLADRAISNFPDKTLRIKINADVKDKTVAIVQTMTHPAHDHLIELLLLADAAKSAKAKKIIAVIPYLAYSKQDQVFLPGEPLSVRVIAQVLSHTSIDEIITLDLHHPHIADFFTIPIHNLSFLPAIASHCEAAFGGRGNLVVVAPDEGAAMRARTVAEKLSLPLIIIDKHRSLTTGKVFISPKRSLLAVGQGDSLKDKSCLVIDDLIVTGATLIESAKFLKAGGAKQISVFATHGLLALQSRSLRARGRRPPAQSKRTAGLADGFAKFLSAGINSITISDSIPHQNLPPWIKTISLASLIASSL